MALDQVTDLVNLRRNYGEKLGLLFSTAAPGLSN